MKFLILTIVLATLIIFTVGPYFGVSVNVTPSLPLGLYIDKDKTTYEVGDIVLFKVPVSAIIKQQYSKKPWWNDTPKYFMKVIYGVSGNTVYQDDETVVINNRQLPRVAGIPAVIVSGPIPPGKLFVGTPHEKSFDSRYWGLIEKEDVLSVIRPLLTYGNIGK